MILINKKPSKKQIILTLIISFLTLFFTAILYFFHYLDKTAEIDIIISPKNSIIKLNNETFINGTHKIKPGNYEVSITNNYTTDSSEPGFPEFTKTIEIKDHTKYKLYHSLIPTEANSNYYQTHPEDYSIAQGIADRLAREEQQSYTNSDPIFLITPYKDYDQGFEIYSEKTNSKISVKITLLTCNEDLLSNLKNQALAWLQSKSINPSKYDITYTSCTD